MNTLNILKKTKSSNAPLLFGCFCHNVTEETLENKIKMVNFFSRMYKLNEKNNEFETVPYDIVNMKETSYLNKINPLATKAIESSDMSKVDSIESALKNKIGDHINLIENKLQMELKDLKAQLKIEIENNKKLYERLTTFET